MKTLFNSPLAYISLFVVSAIFTITFLSGCDDAGLTNDPVVSYVEHFDSIGVVDGIGNVANGINLYNGTTVLRDSTSKDCQLIDSAGMGFNYSLRSGDLSDFDLPIGYQTKFVRLYASMTKAQFDTITVMPVGRDTILPELDFTADDTYANGAWGYFNAPMNIGDSKPVYAFWLKEKSANFIGRNVYGIIFPREATNSGGFRMSFEVRINTHGINDFVHTAH
ncbi:MAG: hypothetical protein K8I03_07725 [Ignavibacteria bacterium]|nr:hypothetical protein [Ignavibacteria bacterium]